MKSLKITLLLAVFCLALVGLTNSKESNTVNTNIESVEKKKNDKSIQFLALDKNHKKPNQNDNQA
ncbi:MAG: hypothetical protein KJO77_00865 [Bacteroidia bacterium]|nr:hypothetical protein [Bacteroidia bacterium]NND51771.1 hypothetical protein [Flavobacteriaceae bacterium]